MLIAILSICSKQELEDDQNEDGNFSVKVQ
jgi:hypothetical protein